MMNEWKAASRIAVLFCLGSPCLADVALIVAEPYGRAGAWAPVGHAAIYLTRACAETPTRLRRCNPDEPGVVISRYGHVAGFDWLAVPLVPYLYAVDRVEDIPDISDAAMVVHLREHYRREHLSSIVPDDRARPTPKGNWIQLIGASYDRKLYFFQIETTAEQDEALIAELNQGANRGRFNLFFHNCADFARDVINHYYPKVIRRNFVADLGMTTPKQVAKSFVHFSRKNQELKFSAYALEQVPGNRQQSRPLRGVTESFLRFFTVIH